MTIDEFKQVMAVAGIKVMCVRRAKRSLSFSARGKNRKFKYATDHIKHRPNADFRYHAWLVPYEDTPAFMKCVGHTEKAALKKLKDWYHYEGRKNANSR